MALVVGYKILERKLATLNSETEGLHQVYQYRIKDLKKQANSQAQEGQELESVIVDANK